MILNEFAEAAEEYRTASFEGDDAFDKATHKVERALLGACMTAGVVPKTPLTANQFLRDAHGEVWKAIRSIETLGEDPELTRVIFELTRAQRLKLAGGVSYVASLLDSTDCSDISVYARLVGEAYRMRTVRRLRK
jgi:replicative DNA helicase